MKKVIALCLALVLVLSIASLCLAGGHTHQWEWQWTGYYDKYSFPVYTVSSDQYKHSTHDHYSEYGTIKKNYKCVGCPSTRVDTINNTYIRTYCPYQ